ncbi:MAG TPA: Zn-dependent protease with chaperone function, partial [Isosphaeraceae bacterium]|nr:Zn-dependent protease with chaperone function [Isosphaeraceae bacterium]
MPFSLLVAIFIAFGFDLGSNAAPISPEELRWRIAEMAAAVIGVGGFALLLGEWIAFRVARDRGPSPATRRSFAFLCRAIDVLTLGVFAWIIYGLDWPSTVEWGLHLHDKILIDEFLILLPYLLAQFLGWWGLYPAERALRADRLKPGRGRYLILRARQALGLVLPVALVFSLGQDLLKR